MTYANCPDTAIAHKLQITEYDISLRADLTLQLCDLENLRLVTAPDKLPALDRQIASLEALIRETF